MPKATERPASRRTAAGQAADPDPQGAPGRQLIVPYVLLALAAEKAHGYLIEQYLRSLGLVEIEMSTLYRTLRQLEKQGFVRSAWEAGPEGPARRVYSLTAEGRSWLDASAAALQGYRRLIDGFFGSYARMMSGAFGAIPSPIPGAKSAGPASTGRKTAKPARKPSPKPRRTSARRP